jgi:diguanylate cyclase (GGDEF)-like protein
VARLEAERAALWWAACHDELTGLANRRLFCTLAPPLLRAGRPAVVVVLDLNGFKPINDALGHDVGDRVLQIVAGRLAAYAHHPVVARLGGDEFASVLASPQREPRPRWWRPAVATLAATIAEPMPVAGHLLNVTASVGVAPPCDEVLITELLRRADLAMYHAKASGHCYAAWDRPRRNLEAPAGPPIVEAALADPTRDPTRDPEPDATTPTCAPYRRDPATVALAGTYQRHDPVWVYREGAWRPGVVESASYRAVMATYRSAAGTGTVVDTMTAEYVLARHTTDPQLDRGIANPRAAAA